MSVAIAYPVLDAVLVVGMSIIVTLCRLKATAAMLAIRALRVRLGCLAILSGATLIHVFPALASVGQRQRKPSRRVFLSDLGTAERDVPDLQRADLPTHVVTKGAFAEVIVLPLNVGRHSCPIKFVGRNAHLHTVEV